MNRRTKANLEECEDIWINWSRACKHHSDITTKKIFEFIEDEVIPKKVFVVTTILEIIKF